MSTDTDSFTFIRQFATSPARMWHLMTDNDARLIWGAPEDGKTLDTLKSDLRVGGEEHHRCGPAEAPDFEVFTRWHHMAEATDAVFTEEIQAGGVSLGMSLVTFRITDHPKGAEVAITVAVSSFVGPEMMGEFQSGWEGGLKKLAALANT